MVTHEERWREPSWLVAGATIFVLCTVSRLANKEKIPHKLLYDPRNLTMVAERSWLVWLGQNVEV